MLKTEVLTLMQNPGAQFLQGQIYLVTRLCVNYLRDGCVALLRRRDTGPHRMCLACLCLHVNAYGCLLTSVGHVT